MEPLIRVAYSPHTRVSDRKCATGARFEQMQGALKDRKDCLGLDAVSRRKRCALM